MAASRGRIFASVGLFLTLAGTTGGFLMFLKPWRYCPEIDDSSAGCPGTPSETALLSMAFLIFALGIAFLVTAIRDAPPPGEALRGTDEHSC